MLQLDDEKRTRKAAEDERDKAVRVLKEGRHTFNDLNQNGKTIFDFLNVWLDQANTANGKLAAELEALKARAEQAERERDQYCREHTNKTWEVTRLSEEMDTLKARALPPARLMRTVEEVEGLRPGNYLVRHRGEDRTIAYERGSDPSWRDPRSPWLEVGDSERVPNAVFVGATVVGPLPDFEPISEQEGASCSG